ncbi:hypothetical protein [Wolbachia endosymbiont of Dactylopius coccus]
MTIVMVSSQRLYDVIPVLLSCHPSAYFFVIPVPPSPVHSSAPFFVILVAPMMSFQCSFLVIPVPISLSSQCPDYLDPGNLVASNALGLVSMGFAL